MEVFRKFRINVWAVFLIVSLLSAFLFFTLDFLCTYFNDDGLYLHFLPDHIFFAELFGLAAAVLFVFKAKNSVAKPWIISGVLTLLFVGFSFWNYYANYSIPATESNYRHDVSYTCIEGEMYSGTLNQTNLCVLRQMPHEDVDFLAHLHLASFTNLAGFDSAEFIVFLVSQLVILGCPLYSLAITQRNTRHFS